MQKKISEKAILNGTLLALLLVSDETGGEEWAIFKGTAKIDAGKLYLDFGSDKPLFEIFPEWYGHIKTVPDNVKNILGGADYYLPLIVGEMPEDDMGLHSDTGLKWPVKLA